MFEPFFRNLFCCVKVATALDLPFNNNNVTIMQDMYNYVPERNHVFRKYCVAAIL
jgi:hypothetical protein